LYCWRDAELPGTYPHDAQLDYLRIADHPYFKFCGVGANSVSPYDGSMRTRLLPIAAVVIGLIVSPPSSAQVRNGAPTQPMSAGGIQWSTTRPADSGIDATALESIYSDMTQEPNHDLKGIVIVRDGHLVSEHYFNGDSTISLHDIRSATKSVTSVLMGIAIQKGLVHGVNDPISLYLPGLPKDGKEKISIKDLLNMRSGLDADDGDPSSPGNENTLDESSDWIRTVYSVPLRRAPGTKYLYCSINAFLAGAIIENASHIPLDQFAGTNLFDPLGIQKYSWRHVPVDRTTGQGNLSITARDEAAIGELMLDDGVVSGRRILTHDWVAKSLASQVVISDLDPYADFYGYMWYTKAEAVGDHKVEVHFASGNGGNKIYIIPSAHMVVAITSSAYGQRYGQRRSQDILLRILAATSSK
jgi:CubicO group peptidase (beta-lactamase class C family)